MLKKTAIAATLTALVSSGAHAFQNEVNGVYSSAGMLDVLAAGFTHHFADVNTADTAWSEAAYMRRSSYLSGGAIHYSVDYYAFEETGSIVYKFEETGFIVAGRATFAESWYAGASLTTVDGSSTNSFTLGYYHGDSKSIYLEFLDSDFDDSSIAIGMKHVYSLAGGAFFNAEAALARTEMEFEGPFETIEDSYLALVIGGDYYFTAQTGLGLMAKLIDDTYVGSSYEIRFSHYFSESVGLELSRAMDTDNSNISTIGLNVRF